MNLEAHQQRFLDDDCSGVVEQMLEAGLALVRCQDTLRLIDLQLVGASVGDSVVVRSGVALSRMED